MLYPVILCGGYGVRLWPWSRNDYPKQFIQVFGKKSLLQTCLNRIKNPQQFHVPVVVTNFTQIETLNKQIKQESIQAHIIVEPYAKGTTPAVTLAALALHHQDRNAVMLVMPADIHIKNNQSFYSLLKESELCALNNNKLILFGTKALYPETGYGYIKYGGRIRANLYDVANFIEKPSLSTARKRTASGDLWNCGIFIFPVKLLLSEIKKHAPEIYHACNKSYIKATSHTQNDKIIYHIDPTAFSKCPADSIDYSILEKSAKLAVLKSNIAWNDIGSWKSLYEIGHKDVDGNILEGEVIAIDCQDTHIINNNPSEIIALIGNKNLTVVKSGNATIILSRRHAQKVKQVVALLNKMKKQSYLNS